VVWPTVVAQGGGASPNWKELPVAVTVTTHRKPLDDSPVNAVHAAGRTFEVVDGHLYVHIDSMTSAAVYAPGAWKSAVIADQD
jgi:hypothetical protein